MNFDDMISTCPKCNGTGKFKAMQMGIRNTNGEKRVERAEDTTVKCDHCLGLGVLMNPKLNKRHI